MTHLIDRELFFGNPTIAGGKLSPDGKSVSFLKEYNGILNLYIKAIDEPFESAILLTRSSSPILGYFWTWDSNYILYVDDSGGDENTNIYRIDPYGANEVATNLTDIAGVKTMIYKLSKHQPDLMWIGINERDPAWHDLYQLEISTGELTLIYENNDRIGGWDWDWDESIRVAYRTDEEGQSEILRVNSLQDFEVIYTTNLQEGAQILGWSPDNKRAYLESNKGDVDLSTVYTLDMETCAIEYYASDPEGRVDFGSLVLDRQTREIVCLAYTDDRVRRYWQNDEWERLYKTLQAKRPDHDVGITSSTEDYQKMLVAYSNDRSVGEVWSYDKADDVFVFQYQVRPELSAIEGNLSPMTAIRYPSSDGLIIPAYLTLPISAVKGRKLPCVVLVHGGPKGPRDNWGFNGAVQFLANRGYAVLQPNFRASGGYGKSFLNAGDKQWGRLMQDDITWGVKYLIDNGTIDPDRIAIMGGSYGGYATLAGLAFTPEVYACGVDIVGPSNLFTLLESIPAYWESGRKWLYEMTGDPETEEGQKLIRDASPLFHVDKINRPLMIVQGANDPRVKQAESDQIVTALRDKGHDVIYLLAEDEGHGFRKPLNRMAMYAEIEKFFAKHLGGAVQSDVTEDVRETIETLVIK